MTPEDIYEASKVTQPYRALGEEIVAADSAPGQRGPPGITTAVRGRGAAGLL
jgi:hypothetical protein